MVKYIGRLKVLTARNAQSLINYDWTKKTSQKPSVMKIHLKSSQHLLWLQSNPPNTKRIQRKRKLLDEMIHLTVCAKKIKSIVAYTMEKI